MTSFVRAALVAVALPAALSSCRQGEGGVCQVNEDCEDGLICNAGTQLCQERGTILPDAAPNADAAPNIDAGPADAAPPADANVDAG